MKSAIAILGALEGVDESLVLAELSLLDGLVCDRYQHSARGVSLTID